jgi:hypothetical protein
MTEHPDMRAIERFAIGALGYEEEEAFASHVAGCDDCSEKLAREARVECALSELAALRKRSAVRASRSYGVVRRRVAPVLILAAAAAVLFFVRRSPRVDIGSDPIAVVPTLGDAPPADGDEVVAKLRPLFRKCFQAGLAADPKMLGGKVVIDGTIAPSGEVVSASLGSSEGLSKLVTDCLVEVVRGARFAPSEKGSTIRIPVSFVRKVE